MQHNQNRLSGINPLSYMGVEANTPSQLMLESTDPTVNDSQNVLLGTIWINTTNQNVWVLTSLSGGQANWQQLETSGLVGGFVKTLTSNSGGAVSATSQNINVKGDGTTITGVGSGSTITLSLIEDVATVFSADNAGTATPLAGDILISGGLGNNISTLASGHTVTVVLSGTTEYCVQVGNAGGSLTSLGTGSAGQVLQSAGAAANPAYSTATYPATTTANQLLYSSANNVVGGVTAGDYGVLISSSSGVPSWLANGTTGQVLTATTSGTASWQAGSSGMLAWTDETSGPVTMAVNNGYTANSGSQITFVLPSTAAYGSIFQVVGKGTGGWTITYGSSQLIHFGAVNTTATTGSLTSTLQYDAVQLLCTVANTEFTVLFSIGNITYA